MELCPTLRHGVHNLHHLTRYAQSCRAARVLDLRLASNTAILLCEDVQRLTSLPRIWTGDHGARVQDVVDMNIQTSNDGDCTDPTCPPSCTRVR